MDFQGIVQLFINGLAIGSIYAVIALGFVLIYSATNVVNFAQGNFTMVGAFVFFALYASGISIWFAFVGSILIMGVFGFGFQLGVYRPFRNRSKAFLPIIVSTLGASFFLKSLFLVIFGPYPRRVPQLIDGNPVKISGINLSVQYITIFIFVISLFIFQHLLFEKTNLGKKLQATAQDPETARLMGIKVVWMDAFTWVYATILGGIAGILLAPLFSLTPIVGTVFGLKAFAAAIVGGFSDVKGAIIGGLGIGVIESFGAYFVSSSYLNAFSFIVLILFLIFKPYGLFGEKVGTKV
ncbi:MAG TPA: branched-chain amino acid ABC transporter permease [Bacillales bacterium]|nr:branched-chain amino acid ABC transporter permease [Bacillales bacterium]